jgi:hypothetical protein
MLGSAIAIGMTNILLSTIHILNEWADSGRVPGEVAQAPFPLFIDCSSSADAVLRRLLAFDLPHLRRYGVNCSISYGLHDPSKVVWSTS